MTRQTLWMTTGLLVVSMSIVPTDKQALAQDQTNQGATVTAPFLVETPTIDGVLSDGEWDAAGVAEGQ